MPARLPGIVAANELETHLCSGPRPVWAEILRVRGVREMKRTSLAEAQSIAWQSDIFDSGFHAA